MFYSRCLVGFLAVVLACASVHAVNTQADTPLSHANTFRLYEHLMAKQMKLSTSSVKDLPEMYFEQTLDHFDPNNQATYRQRYWVNEEYYKPGGPVFLYIGGEAEASSGSILSGEIVSLAQNHSALLYCVEHRYYGKSHPFDNLKTENLKFLSSQQALADLAHFISVQSTKLDGNPWFTVGGSYPGSLSAWFRLKYPHLTKGSIASSAPVEAKMDFYEYDQIVSQAIGDTCSQDIQKATQAVQDALLKSPSTIQPLFECGEIESPVGFLYVLADAVAFSIQYTSSTPGRPTYHLKEMLCSHMADESMDYVNRYVAFTKELFSRLGVNCYDFTTTLKALQNTEAAPSLNQRQWYFQSCNEFGFFQTAPPKNSLRSSLINVTYHLDLCHKAFGIPLVPHTEWTNAYYGGIDPTGSDVYFVNGGIDPWHALSIISPLPESPEIAVKVIPGTSHCADLYPASPTDPPALTAARKDIANHVSMWLEPASHRESREIMSWTTISLVGASAVLSATVVLLLQRRALI